MSFADILDIILVAAIIFMIFRWIRGTSAMSIFAGIISLYAIKVVASALDMKMMSAMMSTVLDVGVIALIVIFQPEIRRFLMKVGNRYREASKNKKFFLNLFGNKKSLSDSNAVNEVTEACRRMSDEKTGALIVIAHKAALDDITETGDKIDAAIHRRLIMNLFFKNSPLHDGAVVIAHDRIAAARCTLPITEKTDIPPNYGMRHKAAIGITEQTDADVVVVSEETGMVSFVKGGEVTTIKNINELKLLLGNSFSE
ncbi:MAG: diadenylate cyclase CdaA [Candidatus Cryptobacteroides sp.]